MANKVYDIVTEKIMNALKEGTIPWKRTWTREMIDNQNPITGTHYKGINTFLTMLSSMEQGFTSPYWYTRNQIKKLKGTWSGKGTLVIYWNLKDKAKEKWTKWEEARVKKDPTYKPKSMILRYYLIWNHDQTEGIEAPAKEEEAPKEVKPINCAEAIAEGYKDKPEVLYRRSFNPSYVPSLDRVRMPPRNAFENAEEFYSTLFHEFGHSTGHKDRLDRLCAANFGGEKYAKEELVAEMTAAFLCARCNIDQAVVENQAAYIKGWMRAIKDDSSMIVHAAAAAQKAADYITG